MRRNGEKKNNGITLIALIITIVVLLILAGVSIAFLTGDNGIITQATEARELNEVASVREQAQLDIANWVAEQLLNGEDTTVASADDVEEILNATLVAGGTKYWDSFSETGIITPNGYEVPFSELYTTSVSGGVTEVTSVNYGDMVNYVSKGDSSLIWQIFYDDEEYVYLISSKEDGSNTVDSCQLNQYPESTKTYSGSADITDSFLKSLNSQWFEVLGSRPSTYDNAKAIAYLMDQDVWDKYKDSAGNASYAIGGPTYELLMNSYNKSEETSNEIEITDCNSYGYDYNVPTGWLSTEYNNGIYNNNGSDGVYWWLSSPGTASNGMICVGNSRGTLYSGSVEQRPSGR